ncbi:hypothetical protein [Methanosarcina sp. 1.H.A.2.2]|uniref:hypothetical protein n=1 Tax=Methanosarcina sp. 1.H.A.2.2 TaxID=1483601 RepID=UPI0006224A29|nr:hypothetical protein [Methanosarcina sp. 1.H.A.2.2]KKH45373.1 hypothetical protein EO93_18200 [Methanosarcina sp. 1.H.A.2.2]
MLALRVFKLADSASWGRITLGVRRMSRIKITISILLLAMLVGMALIPVASAQEESSNGTYSLNEVSEKKAEEVASYSIKEIYRSISNFSDWEDATVKLSTVYYDLDGKRSAYSFISMIHGTRVINTT